MSVQLIINGKVIEFPSSGASPNWAPAVVEFAQAVTDALALAIGNFDVAPQVLNIDAYNPGNNINISPLSFPTSAVRGAIIDYTVSRTTSDGQVTEIGKISIVYDSDATIGQKWSIQRDYVGDASISFAIDDTGQVSFSTTTLSGSGHTGKIAFFAKALTES